MKRLMLFLLSLSLASLFLFACGNPEEGSSSLQPGEEGSSQLTEDEWSDPDWTPPVK